MLRCSDLVVRVYYKTESIDHIGHLRYYEVEGLHRNRT